MQQAKGSVFTAMGSLNVPHVAPPQESVLTLLVLPLRRGRAERTLPAGYLIISRQHLAAAADARSGAQSIPIDSASAPCLGCGSISAVHMAL